MNIVKLQMTCVERMDYVDAETRANADDTYKSDVATFSTAPQ